MTAKPKTLLEMMERVSKRGAELKRLMVKVNYFAVLVLAAGLALHRYVWNSYNLDLYAAGFVAVVTLANHFAMYLFAGFLDQYKRYLPNAGHDDDYLEY